MTKVTLNRVDMDTGKPINPVTLDTKSDEFKEVSLQWLTCGIKLPHDDEDYDDGWFDYKQPSWMH